MLLSDHIGRGAAPLASTVPAEAHGPRKVLAPPPPHEAAPVPVNVPPDRPALAVTAPDLTPLAAFRAPSSPIRLRLHIDASGRVDAVEMLEVAAEDVAFAERLAEIMRATLHIPARRGGKDVASTKEIRLDFSGRA